MIFVNSLGLKSRSKLKSHVNFWERNDNENISTTQIKSFYHDKLTNESNSSENLPTIELNPDDFKNDDIQVTPLVNKDKIKLPQHNGLKTVSIEDMDDVIGKKDHKSEEIDDDNKEADDKDNKDVVNGDLPLIDLSSDAITKPNNNKLPIQPKSISIPKKDGNPSNHDELSKAIKKEIKKNEFPIKTNETNEKTDLKTIDITNDNLNDKLENNTKENNEKHIQKKTNKSREERRAAIAIKQAERIEAQKKRAEAKKKEKQEKREAKQKRAEEKKALREKKMLQEEIERTKEIQKEKEERVKRHQQEKEEREKRHKQEKEEREKRHKQEKEEREKRRQQEKEERENEEVERLKQEKEEREKEEVERLKQEKLKEESKPYSFEANIATVKDPMRKIHKNEKELTNKIKYTEQEILNNKKQEEFISKKIKQNESSVNKISSEIKNLLAKNQRLSETIQKENNTNKVNKRKIVSFMQKYQGKIKQLDDKLKHNNQEISESTKNEESELKNVLKVFHKQFSELHSTVISFKGELDNMVYINYNFKQQRTRDSISESIEKILKFCGPNFEKCINKEEQTKKTSNKKV